MRIVIRGVKRYHDRHGKLRIYHRKSGTPIDASLSDVAVAAEVARLDAKFANTQPVAGTLGRLLASYRASPRYTDLAPRTRDDYAKCQNYLKPLDGTPLTLVDTVFMAKLRDKTVTLKKAGFTNHMIAMLSSAFRHGREYGLVDSNPCAGLAKAAMRKDRKKENRPWSPNERRNVLAVAPPALKLPLALARFLGMRRGDILRLPCLAYRDGHMTFRTSKTGKTMKLPVVGELKSIVEAAIEANRDATVTLLCLNTKGQPWTEAGYSTSIRKFFSKCVERGIAAPGLTMHGLRHSVAAELRAQGFSHDDIKDYLGQETRQMAEHYASSADVSSGLIDMANVIQGGTKRKRKSSNRHSKSV